MQMMRKLLLEFNRWVEYFLAWFPGATGYYLREFYWSRRFKECGKRLRLGIGVQVFGAENISVGDDFVASDFSVLAAEKGVLKAGHSVSIGKNTSLGASLGGEVWLGDSILIAHNVTLRASNHRFDRLDIPITQQGHSGGKIHIQSDVWIGANVVITPQVTLGKGVVVGAGAVVTKDAEPYSIIAGVPAKVIGNRMENKSIP